MKLDARLLIAFIMALALIQGSYAAELSISGGSSATSTNGGSVEGITVASDSTVELEGTFTNGLNIKNWLDDMSGKRVEEEIHTIGGSGHYKSEFKWEDYLGIDRIVDPKDYDYHVAPESNSLSATLKLTVNDASGTRVNVYANNGKGYVANSNLDMGPGSLVDYSNSAKVTKGSATTHQAFNYAWDKDNTDITLRTSAINNVDRKKANVVSTVKSGYVFLYDDTSTSSKKNTESSANVNAVGTIDVDTLSNTKTYDLPSLESSVKLATSVDSVAGKVPKTQVYKGLAFMALDQYALGLIGHAGVGVWNDDGTWTIGSLQGGLILDPFKLLGASITPGEDNNGWCAHDLTWPQVQVLLSSTGGTDGETLHRVPDAVRRRDENGDVINDLDTREQNSYDYIRLIRDSNYIPNPDKARAVMDAYPDRGFWFAGFAPKTEIEQLEQLLDPSPSIHPASYWPSIYGTSNNCLDSAVRALHAYGVPKQDALSPGSFTSPWLVNMEPNIYFDHTLKNSQSYAVPHVDNIMVPANYWYVGPNGFIQPIINQAASGDVITIAPGLFDKENLVIDKSITLKGAGNTESGTVIKGLGTDSVLTIGRVDPGIMVNLYNMLIRGGSNTVGGGINNLGTLNVNGCTISGNTASLSGGGINNGGTVTIVGSDIAGNTAANGGGIENLGIITVTNCNIYDNIANSPWGLGGGIRNDHIAAITDSNIYGNSAGYVGGGIGTHNFDFSKGTTTITNSKIYGNDAKYGSSGIAIYTDGTTKAGTATITDSDIYGNTGTGITIFNGGTATITDSDIHDNTFGGIWVNDNAITTITGSDIHHNTFNGICVLKDAIATITGSDIHDNTRGGIYNQGGIAAIDNSNIYKNVDFGINNYYGTMTVASSNIYENTGYGISNSGTMAVTSSNIYENTGYGIGNDGTMTVTDSNIHDNIGSGIYLYSGSLSLTGASQVTDNTAATGYGAGIYSYSGSLTLDGKNVFIKSNKAHLPPPPEPSWYQGWGVYLESGTPTTTGGFDPTTQVIDNTNI